MQGRKSMLQSGGDVFTVGERNKLKMLPIDMR